MRRPARADPHQAEPRDGARPTRWSRIAAPHPAGDGDAGARGPAGDHHRGRPRHRRAARRALTDAVSRLARCGHRRVSVFIDADLRAGRGGAARSAPRCARSTPGRTRTRSIRAGATPRARRWWPSSSGIAAAGEAIRAPRHAVQRRPRAQLLQRRAGRRARRRARTAHRPRDRQPRGVRRHARGGARDEGARRCRDARGEQRR